MQRRHRAAQQLPPRSHTSGTVKHKRPREQAHPDRLQQHAEWLSVEEISELARMPVQPVDSIRQPHAHADRHEPMHEKADATRSKPSTGAHVCVCACVCARVCV